MRAYTSADFAELYAIEEACFRPPFRFSRRYMKELLENSDGAAWVVHADGAMAGFAIVEWADTSQGAAAYISTIEVLPAFRGRKLGRALLTKCEESAAGAGAQVMWLHVAEGNDTAIRLYERNGFQRLGTEGDFYGPGGDAHIYCKRLG